MAKLPAAVKAAEERADSILNGEAERIAASGSADNKPTESAQKTVAPAQADPSATATPAGVDPSPAKQAPDPQSEQRIKTLQGMIDANNRNHAQEKSELQGKLSALEQQLEKTNESLAQALANGRPSAKEAFSEYDPEIQSVMEGFEQRDRQKDQEIAELKAQVQRLAQHQQHLDSTSADLIADGYVNAVQTALPDLTQINQDPRFAEWVSQPDEAWTAIGEDRTRQEVLEEAHNRADSSKVIAIYNAFKRAAQMQASLQPAQMPAPQGNSAVIAPGGEPKPTYTLEQYQALKKRALRRGMKPDDVAAIERELYDAVTEGRVQGLQGPSSPQMMQPHMT